MPDAPALVVLAWAGPGSLYGVSVDGTVLHSADDGDSWTLRGKTGGPPEAVTVDARDGQEALYLAVAERGVLVSDDGGRSSTVRSPS